MPSDIDAISAIVAMGSTATVAAADGVTIGAVKRLTTARIESRRENKVRNFTQAQWHMVQRKKRPMRSHFCQVMLCDILGRKWLCEPVAKIVLNSSGGPTAGSEIRFEHRCGR